MQQLTNWGACADGKRKFIEAANFDLALHHDTPIEITPELVDAFVTNRVAVDYVIWWLARKSHTHPPQDTTLSRNIWYALYSEMVTLYAQHPASNSRSFKRVIKAALAAAS